MPDPKSRRTDKSEMCYLANEVEYTTHGEAR